MQGNITTYLVDIRAAYPWKLIMLYSAMMFDALAVSPG